MKRIKLALSTEREVLIALLVVLFLVIVLGVTAYNQVVSFATTLSSLDTSRRIALEANDLYRLLLNTETGQRGYIITGDSSYLEPYSDSVIAVNESRSRLTDLLITRPEYIAEVHSLAQRIDEKLDELASTITVRTEQGFEAAQAIVATDTGKSLMDNIRMWLRTLIMAERSHFVAAQNAVLDQVAQMSGLVLGLVLCVIAMGAAVYWMVRRSVRGNEIIQRGLSNSLRRERELNGLRTHFIQTVSHEFRTPLAIIQTSTDLLKHYSNRMTEERRLEHLDKLQAQIAHLTAMLEDAVVMQQSQVKELPYAPSTVDAQAICQQVIDALKPNAEDRVIQLHTVGSSFTLIADGKLLARAITNLLLNAIQYSQPGSPVEIELSNNNGEISIRVRDQGSGIPYNEQPYLFDMFFRGTNIGDVAGAGLGLPVVKSIVELHKGRVICESVPGSGSTFMIALPAHHAVAAA